MSDPRPPVTAKQLPAAWERLVSGRAQAAKRSIDETPNQTGRASWQELRVRRRARVQSMFISGPATKRQHTPGWYYSYCVQGLHASNPSSQSSGDNGAGPAFQGPPASAVPPGPASGPSTVPPGSASGPSTGLPGDKVTSPLFPRRVSKLRRDGGGTGSDSL